MIREDRRRVVQPHLALRQRAHGLGRPAELEQRLAANRGGVDASDIAEWLRYRAQHVERGLRAALGELEPREQHGDSLLLRGRSVAARVVQAAARDGPVAGFDRVARGFEQVVDARGAGRAGRELRVQIGRGAVVAGFDRALGARFEVRSRRRATGVWRG